MKPTVHLRLDLIDGNQLDELFNDQNHSSPAKPLEGESWDDDHALLHQLTAN